MGVPGRVRFKIDAANSQLGLASQQEADSVPDRLAVVDDQDLFGQSVPRRPNTRLVPNCCKGSEPAGRREEGGLCANMGRHANTVIAVSRPEPKARREFLSVH